jgi:hypothetical protein
MADFPFVRVKGSNSDYVYAPEAQSVVEVENLKDIPAYLQIFICPYGMPSPVDQVKEPPFLSQDNKAHTCDGVSDTCPRRTLFPNQPYTGHAKIRLHQTEGITLTTDNNNQLTLDQAGVIKLASTKQVEIVGDLLARPAGAPGVQLNISKGGVSLQVGEAVVSIDDQGNINLKSQKQARVSVQGNLVVTGDITIPTIANLRAELEKLNTELAGLKTEVGQLKAKLGPS